MLWRQLSGCCVVTCWLLSWFERRGWSLLPPCSILASLCMSLTLPDVCVGIQGALKAFFSFSSRQSYLFLSPLSLFLFALDLLKASVCIPKPLREVATNKEDYCLCIKKKTTAISGVVSLSDSPHIWVTCSAAVSFHPASQRRTKQCHQKLQSVQSPRRTGDKINSSLEWNYCRLWTAISHLVLLKHS